MATSPVALTITGMSCGHCVGHVRRALERLDGVTVKEVAIGRALVEIDDARRRPDDLVHAVGEAGYTATLDA